MSEKAQARWFALKEEYFERIMSGEPVTLSEMADKHGFGHQSVRNKSSQEKWPAQIEAMKLQREKLVGEKLAERTTLVLDKLNEEFATNEVEIRKRHALIARGLQIRAVKRLKELEMSAFSPKDALAMLKLGLDEERRALGLPEVAVPTPPSEQHPEYRSVSEQMGGHRKVQAVGMMLLKALRENADQIIDVEADLEGGE